MNRIVFLTCHLTGTGHLVRTLAIARAAAGRGHAATVITGGRPLAHLDPGGARLVQLPPVAVTDFDYATLRRPDGSPADAGYMEARRGALVAALAEARPEALVTETWPFGRRVLREEFEAAAGACPDALLVASVRDVPEPKPKRVQEVADRLRRGFAAVLVHGDPDFLPLSASWELPEDLAPMIRHTGYVDAGAPRGDAVSGGTVLVAVGGGITGRALLGVAAEAARSSGRPWHLLVGGADGAEVAAGLRAGGVRAEPARPDYRALLAEAAVSVSLAGYNTVMDLASCTTPALLVPSEASGDREQTIRAVRLAREPGFRFLREGDLTPEALAGEVDRLAGMRRPPLSGLRIDRGEGAATALEALLARAGR